MDPEPRTKAPPWIHTSTGALPAVSGVQTLRLSCSSPSMRGSLKTLSSGARYGFCVTVGPNVVASRSPTQRCGDCAGRNRLAAVIGAAYGRPRNRVTPSTVARSEERRVGEEGGVRGGACKGEITVEWRG